MLFMLHQRDQEEISGIWLIGRQEDWKSVKSIEKMGVKYNIYLLKGQ